jgi:hypothetical protein
MSFFIGSINRTVVYWGREKTKGDAMDRSIKRECSVCGKEMIIGLGRNGEYSGGNYFGMLRTPSGAGEYKKIGKSKVLGHVDVVEWIGDHREDEYWECDECYRSE